MELIENKIRSWEDIKKHCPDEWVVLGNPIFDGMTLLEGVILSHHSDKRVASIEGGERREGFNKFTLIFTGRLPPKRHIGLLRKLHNATKTFQV